MLLRRSIELDPRSWESHVNLAAFFGLIGRVEETIEMTDKTIKLLENVATGQQAKIIDELKAQKILFENILVEARKKYKEDQKKFLEQNKNS